MALMILLIRLICRDLRPVDNWAQSDDICAKSTCCCRDGGSGILSYLAFGPIFLRFGVLGVRDHGFKQVSRFGAGNYVVRIIAEIEFMVRLPAYRERSIARRRYPVADANGPWR